MLLSGHQVPLSSAFLFVGFILRTAFFFVIIKVADTDSFPTGLAVPLERTSSFLIIPAQVLKRILTGQLKSRAHH